MNDRQTMNQRSRLTLDDVYYVLFKHKWKIITCSTAGLLGAVALVAFRPPIYESEAKLFIRYVLDSKSPSPTPDGSRMISSYDGQTVINSEIEILNSLDLAEQVVDTIGAGEDPGQGRWRQGSHSGRRSSPQGIGGRGAEQEQRDADSVSASGPRHRATGIDGVDRQLLQETRGNPPGVWRGGRFPVPGDGPVARANWPRRRRNFIRHETRPG